MGPISTPQPEDELLDAGVGVGQLSSSPHGQRYRRPHPALPHRCAGFARRRVAPDLMSAAHAAKTAYATKTTHAVCAAHAIRAAAALALAVVIHE